MSYSKLYFNKEVSELTYEDIEFFFTQEREESDKIEFKSYENTEGKNHTEKENVIIKNICALLNSEGGIIIWGAPLGKALNTETKRKTYLGQLSPTKELIEKDRFINRVTDLITPSPRGVQFQGFKKDSNYIYILEVEKSIYSPHQYRNNYFMRLDGQTVYAPHHYIEALFKKITFPRLEGYIRIDNVRVLNYSNDANYHKYSFRFSLFVFNQSKFQNEYDLNCRIVIDQGVFVDSQFSTRKDKSYTSGKELILSPAKNILFYGEPFYHVETIDLPFGTISDTLLLKILFFFGGKTSPLMLSEYLVSLKSIPVQTDNYNIMFQYIKENQYLHEDSELIGISEKEQIKRTLGR